MIDSLKISLSNKMFSFIPVLLLLHPDFGQASGFWHGFAHPLTGLDHILAMIAVGIWAVQIHVLAESPRRGTLRIETDYICIVLLPRALHPYWCTITLWDMLSFCPCRK